MHRMAKSIPRNKPPNLVILCGKEKGSFVHEEKNLLLKVQNFLAQRNKNA